MNEQLSDIEQRLADLKANGEHHFDPVRYNHATALLQKASQAREPVQVILCKKTLCLLDKYQQDLIEAEENSCRLPRRSVAPKLLAELQGKLNNRHRRKASAGDAESISECLLEKEDATLAAAGFDTVSHQNPTELQAYIALRASKKKFETDKLVDAIINDHPEVLGPLNPQLLLIRSLQSMRELSPHYLSRFVSYIDTLVRLEEAEMKAADPNAELDQSYGKNAGGKADSRAKKKPVKKAKKKAEEESHKPQQALIT